MSRIEEAKKDLEKLYNDSGIQIVIEAMDIVSKYASTTGKTLMESSVDELQADALKLCSLNFYLATMASNRQADAVQACNKRRYQFAQTWSNAKKSMKNEKNAPISDKACDSVSEEAIYVYRCDEADKQKTADILNAAVSSVQEVVNMLKKVVERLLIQGPQSNL